jgi:hypothetical protein
LGIPGESVVAAPGERLETTEGAEFLKVEVEDL